MQKLGIAMLVSSVLVLGGCGPKDLTPEERAYVAKLETELGQTKLELGYAEQTAAQYSGGMIKALASSRIEILKTNQALIEQRILSVSSGAPVKVETLASTADEALAAALASEIEKTKAQTQAANAEAAQYSGGLIKALKLSAAATGEQTLAMLEQRYLVARYGLNPTVAHSTASSPAPSTPALPAQPAQPTVTQSPALPPADGPLGLAAGLSKDLIEQMTGERLVLTDDGQNLYQMNHAPKSNQAFEAYALVISPTVGLCQIRAIGKTIDTNGFGHQLKSGFDELSGSLTSIYGPPQTLDMLMPGSIWKDPDDWMMGLYKKDRSLMADWTGSSSVPLKSSLKSVILQARALGSDKGYVLLQYSFTNDAQCQAEAKTKASGSL